MAKSHVCKTENPLWRLPLEIRRVIWRRVVGDKTYVFTMFPQSHGLFIRIESAPIPIGSFMEEYKKWLADPMTDPRPLVIIQAGSWRRLSRSSTSKPPAIFFTARQIFLEAEEVMLNTCVFAFADPFALRKFERLLSWSTRSYSSLCRDRLAQIRNIFLHIEASQRAAERMRNGEMELSTWSPALITLRNVHLVITDHASAKGDKGHRDIRERIYCSGLFHVLPADLKRVTCIFTESRGLKPPLNAASRLHQSEWVQRWILKRPTWILQRGAMDLLGSLL